MINARSTNPSLTEKEAACYLGISRYTLRNWRFLKKGPTYRKYGKVVRYALIDLQSWADKQAVVAVNCKRPQLTNQTTL